MRPNIGGHKPTRKGKKTPKTKSRRKQNRSESKIPLRRDFLAGLLAGRFGFFCHFEVSFLSVLLLGRYIPFLEERIEGMQ